MKHRPWTEWENSLLVDLVENQGVKPSLLRIPWRTNRAAKNQLAKLRKQGEITKRFKESTYGKHTPYTTSQMRLIRKHTVEAGQKRLGASKLAEMPELAGHTESSIASVISSNGFSDKKRGRIVRNSKKLSAEVRAKLAIFIQGRGRYWSSVMIVNQFSKEKVSYSSVDKLRRRLGVQFNHKTSLAKSKAYREWFKKTYEQSVKTKRAERRKIYQENRRWMEKRKEQIDGFANPPFEDSCIFCKASWPFTDQFFRVRYYRLKSGRKGKYLTRVCIACPRRGKLGSNKA